MFEAIAAARTDNLLATINLAHIPFAVFRLQYPSAVNQAELDRLVTSISQEEREALASIPAPERRLEFAVSRALRRRIVGILLGVAPEELHFRTTAEGKPFLWQEQVAAPRFFFNYSHSATHILLAVTRYGPIGVDVELVADYKAALARRFYHPSEYSWLCSLPEAEQAAGFYQLWVIKEACVKAHGAGLQLLHDVHVSSAVSRGIWRDVQWNVLSMSRHLAAAVAIISREGETLPLVRQSYDLSYTWLYHS